MGLEYDSSSGILFSSLAIRATVVSQVLKRREFYLLLGFHSAVSFAHKMGFFDPDKYYIPCSLKLTGVTGGLMTFFVVFYNGNVFARYNRLYDLTKQMNENCLYTCAILVREIPCKNTVRKLSRMMLASSLLFFFERTPHSEEDTVSHMISVKEWETLQTLGLIDSRERQLLEKHCNLLGESAVPSFMLLQWSMKLYRTKVPRLAELEKAYWRIRKCQDEVVEILELPMPFQYFHIMNLMLMLNLTLWAYAFALESSYVSSLIYLFIQLVFQGIRELSIALSDPYGSDDADFPLNDWINTLYVRIVSCVEDPWELNHAVPVRELRPLPAPEPGEMVVDLMADLDPERAARTSFLASQGRRDSGAMTVLKRLRTGQIEDKQRRPKETPKATAVSNANGEVRQSAQGGQYPQRRDSYQKSKRRASTSGSKKDDSEEEDEDDDD